MKRIKTPQQAVTEARKLITSYNKEHVIGVYLGPENDLRHVGVITMGTLDASIIHPRDVFEPAISKGCSGLVLLHNHPTSNLDPSPSDLKVTKRIQKSAEILQIKFLDHIIFWKGRSLYSMMKHGHMKK